MRQSFHSICDSIVDRLFGEDFDLAVESQAAGWVKLGHENDNHVFFRIDGERGVKEAAPADGADGTEFIERALCARNAKAKPEALVRVNFSKLVVRHELDCFAAEDSRAAEFAAVQDHLREAGIVHRGGRKSRAAGE